jgi:hypothetical protein
MNDYLFSGMKTDKIDLVFSKCQTKYRHFYMASWFNVLRRVMISGFKAVTPKESYQSKSWKLYLMKIIA